MLDISVKKIKKCQLNCKDLNSFKAILILHIFVRQKINIKGTTNLLLKNYKLMW